MHQDKFIVCVKTCLAINLILILILINKEEHKLSLYADDVILYLTETTSTIPHLKRLISQYRSYSGYKDNVDKTVAMIINGGIPQSLKLQSGFRWPKEGIKYLGIYIPQTLQNLYEANYSKIIMLCLDYFVSDVTNTNPQIRLW